MERITKIPSGIAGLDHITVGGMPQGRTTLVAGTPGSAKTVFAAQFLAEGIRQFDEPGVFVTFEEPPADLRRNLAGFGWDVADWESKKKWTFVDASPEPTHAAIPTGAFDLGALVARVEHAVQKTGAKRVALDSLGAVFTQLGESALIRHEIFRIASALRKLGVTSVITAERVAEYGDIARFGVEEFVADNVILVRNALEDEKRRRTLEVLKFRGTSHQKGEFPFSVTDAGIVVIPLSAIELKQKSGTVRVTSGSAELDAL